MKTPLLALLLPLALPILRAGAEGTSFPVDVVAVGRVDDSRMMVHRKPRTTLFYVRLKMEVESVESGRDRVGGAPFLDIRCWREGEDGHLPIPADGARFRAKLAWSEEGYWLPSRRNAFELLDGSEERAFPDLPPRQSRTGAIVGGVLGLLAVAVIALLRQQGRGSRKRAS